MRPEVVVIAAVAENGVIGKDNTLPWRLPRDLKHFKDSTLGHAVLMGRKTYDSLGRPLPGRMNLVLSRRLVAEMPGLKSVRSLEDALESVKPGQKLFIAGGQALYEQFMPFADRLVITHVGVAPEGDAFFPDIDLTKWRIDAERLAFENSITLTFREYVRH
ncbi:dihydrofolate reductase [Paraburkholderia sp. UCT31]|uniref:dihydrofolate reductase n=1 Tax=Paraburkholderia sp. UCT31 TaxID=2615209 RepID=UPI00165555EA|nr:dihydrofolate reductase [Paraburkholderia sp. UCT31]MBC8737378.1 dihydrofolate reductase [Paraburkholderia sp. UCT31]